MKNNNIEVSVIIVNYNTAKLTVNAITSFIEKNKEISYEIIVIDNSQTKDDFNYLNTVYKEYTFISIIKSNENLGFGKANNLAATYAKGKYLYFLNEDTVQINDACVQLLNAIKETNNVGIAQSNLFTINMKPTSSYDLYENNYKEEKKHCSIIHILKNKFIKSNQCFNYTNDNLEINGFPIAASTMISKCDFDKIGGFDKDIFLYSEDVLLGYQVLHDLNKKIISVPNSKVIHLEGGADSFKQTSLFKANAVIDGKYIYFKKIYGEEVAYKVLKKQLRFHKKCWLIYKILFKKENVNSQSNYIRAIKNKIFLVNGKKK